MWKHHLSVYAVALSLLLSALLLSWLSLECGLGPSASVQIGPSPEV